MSTPRGSIALAAYRPDRELFTRQLESLQQQTLSGFECVISADGDSAALAETVRDIVGGDARFRVIGFDRRVGFYRNFERALRAVDPESAWVALCDQDDLWYPEKLERLVPLLDRHTIASGQARVVAHPSGAVLTARTRRRAVGPLELTAINQFSGAMSVFRREVLDLALPFPGMRTRAEVHDHWIAVCAAVLGPTAVIDDILQEYVQHDANVLGEPGRPAGLRPTAAWRTLTSTARRLEGSSSPGALIRSLYAMGYGWRTAMVTALLDRRGPDDPTVAELGRVFGPRARLGASLRSFTPSDRLDASNAVMLAAGRLLHPVTRGRLLAPAATD